MPPNMPLITKNALLMGRAVFADLPVDLQKNAESLLKSVNALLDDLGITSASVSSGYRTPDANAAAGGAKKSLHMQCLAIDLLDDKQQSLAKKILENTHLLEKHGLWLENPAHTIGKNTNWVHLDKGTRAPRAKRVFNP